METLPLTSSPDAPLPSLLLPQKPTSCSPLPYSEPPFPHLSSSSNPPILSALSSPFRCHDLQRPCPDFIQPEISGSGLRKFKFSAKSQKYMGIKLCENKIQLD